MGTTAGGAPDDSYGFVARDVVVQQTDASGRLQYELTAAQVERRDDTSPLTAHELSLQSQPADASGNVIPGRHWTLRSDQGQLPVDGEELRLEGNVEVNALLPGLPRPLTLRTDNLTYNTREQILQTAAQVLFSSGLQKLQGTGLQANVRKGTLKLQSNIHALITP
jgi:LPS export ABC transporter protein LptC